MLGFIRQHQGEETHTAIRIDQHLTAAGGKNIASVSQRQLDDLAVDLEESVYDGHCFAVPIFGSEGDVGAAVSLSLPKSRERDAEHRKAILAALRATADQIAARAYAIWERHGRAHGRHVANWLQAERDFTSSFQFCDLRESLRDGECLRFGLGML